MAPRSWRPVLGTAAAHRHLLLPLLSAAFRGVSADQDSRFTNKEKKLMKVRAAAYIIHALAAVLLLVTGVSATHVPPRLPASPSLARGRP